MTNRRVAEIAEINDMSCEVRRRRCNFNWLGTRSRERARERLHDRTRVDASRSKGKRKTKEDLEKNCGKRAEQGRVDELECGRSGGTEQGGLGSQRDGL